eukprot:gb/GEZN01013222.1/.p1 GENE.gb/GEZN01013222.1/~~gb/GEZN01013222.1/.p1  ORF type:complete len:310 (+),score=20.06 gb/GEZN01013222.1/:64-930(+)
MFNKKLDTGEQARKPGCGGWLLFRANRIARYTVHLVASLMIAPVSTGLANALLCVSLPSGKRISIISMSTCMSPKHLAFILLIVVLVPFWWTALRMRLLQGNLQRVHERFAVDWSHDTLAASCYHDFMTHKKKVAWFTIFGTLVRICTGMWTVLLAGKHTLLQEALLLSCTTLLLCIAVRYPPFVEKRTNSWNLAICATTVWFNLGALTTSVMPEGLVDGAVHIFVYGFMIVFAFAWVVGEGIYVGYEEKQYRSNLQLRALRQRAQRAEANKSSDVGEFRARGRNTRR